MSESQTENEPRPSVGQACRSLLHAADDLAAAGLMYDTLMAVVESDELVDALVIDAWQDFTVQLEATAKVIDDALLGVPPPDHSTPEEATPDE